MFERVIKVRDAAGELVERPAVMKALERVEDATEYVLEEWGGCMGGTLAVATDLRQSFALEVGEFVEFYDGDGESEDPVYRGRVTDRVATINDQHRYELNGAWARLAGAALNARQVFTGQAPETILEALLEEIDGLVPGVSTEGADIAASGVTIGEFVVGEGDTWNEILQGLALAAEGNSGVRWVAGVNGADRVYFGPLLQEADPAGLEIVIGGNAEATEETQHGLTVANQLDVIGGWMPEKGRLFRWPFADAASVATHGAKMQRRLVLRWFTRKADVQRAVDAYFAHYAGLGLEFQDVRIALPAGMATPRPWARVVRYRDVQRGVLAQTFISRLSVRWGALREVTLTVGGEPDTASARTLAPTLERDEAQHSLVGLDVLGEILPFATDLDDPYEDAPSLGGDGNGGGSGPSGGGSIRPTGWLMLGG